MPHHLAERPRERRHTNASTSRAVKRLSELKTKVLNHLVVVPKRQRRGTIPAWGNAPGSRPKTE